MKYRTHTLTPEQKESLFNKHKDLIYIIHSCGDMMLRKQIKRLYHLLFPEVAETTIEFDIAELICAGFLLQKQIQKPSRTQMLYLSKYPRSHFYSKKNTGDVPALSFSVTKIYYQIFATDYLMTKIIPEMVQQNFMITMENIIIYLNWTGNNLLTPNNYSGNYNFYKNVCAALQCNFRLSEDFARDMIIAENEMERSMHILSSKNKDYPICQEKKQRDIERDSYLSDNERQKYFYNLKNFAKSGFILEGVSGNTIKIAFFDHQNSIQHKKLWTNLSYILLMFQRYCNDYDVEIEVTVYVYDEDRKNHLIKEECTEGYDFYRQELTGLPKKQQVMRDVGVKAQFWDSIHTTYKVNPVFENYNIQP